MSVSEAIFYIAIGVLGIFFLAVILTLLDDLLYKRRNKKISK